MFECHITIEPVQESRLAVVEQLATKFRFRLAKLLMQNRATGTLQRSIYDTFVTGHDNDHFDLHERMSNLCKSLTAQGFHVWRYKIEEIILDSRNGDHHGLLSKTSPAPPK